MRSWKEKVDYPVYYDQQDADAVHDAMRGTFMPPGEKNPGRSFSPAEQRAVLKPSHRRNRRTGQKLKTFSEQKINRGMIIALFFPGGKNEST